LRRFVRTAASADASGSEADAHAVGMIGGQFGAERGRRPVMLGLPGAQLSRSFITIDPRRERASPCVKRSRA